MVELFGIMKKDACFLKFDIQKANNISSVLEYIIKRRRYKPDYGMHNG